MSSIIKKWTGTSLVLRIAIGLVLGAILGLVVPQWTGIGILGHIFVSALKAIAPVLVAFLVCSSIAKAQGGLGPRFRTVIILYLSATLVAAAVAVAGSFLFPVTIDLKDAASGSAPGGLADVFKNLLSNMVMNPLQAIATANYIGILFWAIIMGLGLKLVASEGTIKVISEISDVITLMVKWIIQFAPSGILGLVFTAVSESGLEIFSTYGRLILVLVGLAILYISNLYAAQQEIIEHEELRKELTEKKNYALTQYAELTMNSRQSSIENRLKGFGDSLLTAPKEPPFIIRVKE